VDGGRLRVVIDFGAAGAADPAADVIAAWSVFGATQMWLPIAVIRRGCVGCGEGGEKKVHLHELTSSPG